MRTSDGGYILDATKVKNGESNFEVESDGLAYVDQNKLFMTFMQTSEMRSNGSVSNYAGFFSVGRYDPLTNSETWRKELVRFGYSSVLGYKNYGTDTGNIFIGGAIDINRLTANSQNANWRLGIMRITEDGNAPAQGEVIYYINN